MQSVHPTDACEAQASTMTPPLYVCAAALALAAVWLAPPCEGKTVGEPSSKWQQREFVQPLTTMMRSSIGAEPARDFGFGTLHV